MFLEPRLRDRAERAGEASRLTSEVCALIAPAALVFAVINPSIVLAPVGIDLVRRLCDAMEKAARRIADDPPRSDFEMSTQAGRFELEPIEYNAIGGFVLEEFQMASKLSVANLDAFLRAIERQQGAIQSKESRFVAARAEEAQKFAGTSSGALAALSRASNALAEEMRIGENERRLDARRDDIRDFIERALKDGKGQIESAAYSLVLEDPTGAYKRAVLDFARMNGEFSDALGLWRNPSSN